MFAGGYYFYVCRACKGQAGREGRDMRGEWWNRGYADGVAYVGECVSGVCPNCGDVAQVFTEHDGCGNCVVASVHYSYRHGILSDGLADVHAGGRVLPRVNGALVGGFLTGVRAGVSAKRVGVTA